MVVISRRSLVVGAPAIIAASSVSALSISPFAYPTGLKPGFNPKHIAVAGGINSVASVVCLGSANMVSTLNRTKVTAVNNPGVALISGIGPALKILSGTGTCTMPASTVTPSGETVACILQLAAINTTVTQAFVSGSTAAGVSFNTLNPTSVLNFYFNGNNLANFGLTGGVPYFIAASLLAATTVNFLRLNLVTGQVITSVKSSGVTSGAIRDNPISFGSNVSGTQPMLGYLAAAMYSPVFLQMQELMQWAQRPWDFWYPSTNLIPKLS